MIQLPPKLRSILLLWLVCATGYSRLFAQTADHYSVYQKDGKIVFTDANHDHIISSSPNDTLPILLGDKVYYVNNTRKNNAVSGTVMVYDIKSGQTTDLLRTAANNAEYTFKEPIANMLVDGANNKLYFSTMTISNKGIQNCVTWLYDVNTGTVSAYKDGLITAIDEQGRQTIIFYGLDYKGAYSDTHIYTKAGEIYKALEKEYKAGQ